MNSPKISPRQVVYEDRHQQIYQVSADFGDFQKEYFVRDSGPRAGVAVVREGAILLVRQYRLLIDRLSWEIPGGKVDDGETPESAAIRECLEETGLLCRNLKPLIFYHPGLDTFHNPTHLFYTQNFVEQNRSVYNPQETVEHAWVPLTRCIEMIFNQEIVDAFSIVAILAYQNLNVKRTVPTENRNE
jgi:8-oxo-dGTP pyrophosphatase MutT (NUDIX family)